MKDFRNIREESRKKCGKLGILSIMLVMCLAALFSGCTGEKKNEEVLPEVTTEPTKETGVYSTDGTYLGALPTKTTITFEDGRSQKAYMVFPLDYTSWDKVGGWSEDKISFGSAYGPIFELYGDIKNCYGLSISILINAKNGTGKEGFKLGMSHDGKWTYGDYHNEETIEKGESALLRVYNYDAGTVEGFVDMPASAVEGSFSYNDSLNPDLCLYFATQEDAEAYIRSIC